MEIISKYFIISGAVQGVGYRYSANNTARKFGVKGFVKNHSDGTVHIHAEGSSIQVNNFLKWCYKGPIGARVLDIQIETCNPEGYKNFSIKH